MPARDPELVARAVAGDRAAEEAIYRRHAPYLAGMTTRMLANSAEVEDVLQDTFLLALQHLPRLRDPAALRPWLAQIAVSQVRRRLRKRRLLRFLGLERPENAAALAALAAPRADPEMRAALAAIGEVLEALPVEQRVAWSLRYIEGGTLEEVASACGCSLATVKRRVSAAHARVLAVVELRDDEVPFLPVRPHRQAEAGT
jgi:RNA polymerase sigma-70 factor (ECF subfamily)